MPGAALPPFRSLASAALAGIVTVAAFEPAGLAPLAIATLAGLMLLWHRSATPAGAAWTGFAFGLGYFGAGVSWVYVSLHTFGMMPAALAALATVLFCAFLALFPALTGYLQSRAGSSMAVRWLLVVPAAWTLLEWVRGWIFTGFPWLSLGYSQATTPLAGFAPVLGVFGVSLLTLVCAGLLVYSAREQGKRRLMAAAALLVLVTAGWLLRDHDWTQPEGPAIRVALAQGNVPQSLKFEPGRYAATLQTYRRLAELAGAENAKLVVFPETAIPRMLDQVEGRYLEDLQDLMQARNADLLLGAPLRDRDGRYYNSVVSLGSSRSQRYDKVHLVPFGEFIPAGFDWILQVLQIPLSDFSAGTVQQRPLALGRDHPILVAVNICYEDAFGEEIIRQLPEATLLANVSNVAWFGDSLAPDQHLQISQMRAMETGRYMLRATNSGVTAIIDEKGVVRSRLPKFTEGLLNGSAQAFAGATPFVRWGNGPALALCWLMLAAGALLARRRTAPEAPV